MPWYKNQWIINSIVFLIALKFSLIFISVTGDPVIALYPFLFVSLLLFFRPIKLIRNTLAVTASAWKWIAGKADGRQSPWHI